MNKITNLTQTQVDKIQIDEAIVFANYGTVKEYMLGPTRGGGEFTVSNTLRDIEFDGKRGKTKGLQVIEEQSAKLKIVSLCCSQENLALAIPGCIVKESGNVKTITNSTGGVIQNGDYIENVTMFAKLLDGTYKKISIFNAMHEGEFAFKAIQKAEGELNIEFDAHFDPFDQSKLIWSIDEIPSIPTIQG